MGATDISVLDGLNTTAAEFRAALNLAKVGVLTPADFKVTQRTLGTNRSVDVAPGRMVLNDSTIATFPNYMCPNYIVAHDGVTNSDAFELGGIAAPHSTFVRFDQIIARLYDNSGGLRKWRLEVLKGADPTTHATFANRHGAANLPVGAVMRLADVLVPTNGVITNNEIQDRRQYARGYNYVAQIAGITTFGVANTWKNLFSTNLEVTSNYVLRLRMNADVDAPASITTVKFRLVVNGASYTDPFTSFILPASGRRGGALFDIPIFNLPVGNPTAFALDAQASVAGVKFANTGAQTIIEAEEMVRPYTTNVVFVP
jgi:hypothetical protein